jgi:hypothetical protein
MSEKKYVFRRINGRVVPIRVKKDTDLERKKKAVALGAASVGVGATGALTAAGLVKRSADVRIKAKKDFRLARALEKSLKRDGMFGQLSLGLSDPVARNFKREALKNRKFSALMFKMRNPLLAATSLVAGNLLGSAVIEATKKRETVTQEVAINTAAGLATLGVSALYYRGLGVRGARGLRQAFARTNKKNRPWLIPIVGKQGTLKF